MPKSCKEINERSFMLKCTSELVTSERRLGLNDGVPHFVVICLWRSVGKVRKWKFRVNASFKYI
jgi:hypothetical protein